MRQSASNPPDLTESMEDYLEQIFNLTCQQHVARVRDIAASLDVSMSSVTGALKKLAARGLIHYDKYQYITLTDEGQALASEIKGRHRILARFLEDALGVEAERAETNACRMEHALDPDVIERFLRLLELHEADSARPWASQFRALRSRRTSGARTALCPDEASLESVPVGARAIVTRIDNAETGDRRIAGMGLLPGTALKVGGHLRGDGSLVVEVDGESICLTRDELSGVHVRSASHENAAPAKERAVVD